MIDLMIFSVDNNRYAINIENVQRIIQAIKLTSIPNAHEYIDGMMSYEDTIIKILNFRQLIGIATYDKKLKSLFTDLKDAHQVWIDELKLSIENGASFTKATDPNKCELGIWLNNFNSYDDEVSIVLKHLIQNHKKLHIAGGEVLEELIKDKEAAKKTLDTKIYNIFNQTMNDIDIFINSLESVANSLQKLIFYENGANRFAIKVDKIEDIAHVEESDIMSNDEKHSTSEFLELDGVLDINGLLINIIKTIKLPS